MSSLIKLSDKVASIGANPKLFCKNTQIEDVWLSEFQKCKTCSWKNLQIELIYIFYLMMLMSAACSCNIHKGKK